MNAAIDISDIELKTPRLLLRPWRHSDLDDFFEYASVPGVGEMAGWGHHRSIEDSRAILERFIENKKTFALEYGGGSKSSPYEMEHRKVIGSLGIEEYKEEVFPELKDLKCRELGFVLSRDYWGLGLMPEAAGAVIDWLFEEQGLGAIVCGHFLYNTQSARVQEKCGFKHHSYGTYNTQTGRIEQHEYMILTREEWCRE